MRKHVAALTPLVDEHLTQRLSATAWTTLDLIGRLKADVSAEMANAALTPPRNPVAPLRPQAPVVEALTAVLTRSTRSLALGAAAAGLLIFLSCAANIANLLLTRVAYRTREFATRQALGATRFDLARLVLVELAGLMAAAIATGLGLAAMALKVINLVMPAEYASLGTPAIDGRSAVFACAIGSLAMLAGLVPAWVAWHVKTNASLGQLRMADGRGIRAMRFAMTAGQAAVAMVLMTGGCLLVRSYARLVNQDVGFSRDAFVIGVRYPSDQEARLLADIPETIARLRHVPGVLSVAAVRGPLANNMFSTGMVAANGHRTFAGMKSVTPAYADATGSVLTAGRFFTSKDGDGARVVNQAFARMCCTGQSAVGTIVVLGDGHQATIVGILKDAFDTALDKPPAPLILAPLPTVAPQSAGGALINYVFRAESTDQTFLLSAERQLLAVNPSGVVSDEATLGERLSHTVNDRSFATLVMTLFSVAALVVSATGLMGVVGFSVARRTREIAIRVAVGARSAHVRWLVAREAVSAASIGAVCGLVGGAWLSRTLTHFLYGIQPADPASLLLAVVAMAAVTASAATIPANKALRIAPTDALRSE
jgi:predicted permease